MPLKDAKFGDLIAFDGKGKASTLIKIFSGGNISHVALVLSELQLIESTFMDDDNGDNGVSVSSIDDVIDHYKGDAWHISLKEPVADVVSAYEYALDFVGTPYDIVQAGMSALDIIMDNKEDFNALYCSDWHTCWWCSYYR